VRFVQRRRVLRVLVPALLVPFLLVIVFALRERPATRTVGGPSIVPEGPRVEDLRFDDLLGPARRLSLHAKAGWQDAQGAWHLEGVERLEIDREDGPPIVVRAARGSATGGPGQRVFRLEGGVEIREEEHGLLVSLPTLEVDQPAGVARSLGNVEITADRFSGTAREVVYGLNGQPTEVRDLALRSSEGATLRAPLAFLKRGSEEAELSGGVHAERAHTTLDAGTAKLTRGEGGKLRMAHAESGVVATDATPGKAVARLSARSAEFHWSESGDPSSASLRGDAQVQQGESSIAAPAIDVAKDATGGSDLHASQGVVARGLLREGPGQLRCDDLVGTVDAEGRLTRGKATGHVRFDSKEATGEAAVATFEVSGAKEIVTLDAGVDQRARLVRGETRVVADRIVSPLDGSRLVADGKVEATMLPRPKAERRSSAPGMFRAGTAVHFVANHLDAENFGKKAAFRGSVRSWQGDRNLSADEVTMDQDGDTMLARGNVSTRMPRSAEGAAAAGDFVQVSSEKLDYSGVSGRGVYTGSVKIRLGEGWMESARLEIDVSKETSEVDEARAFDGIRMEFRSAAKDGKPASTMSGEGDRVVYTPGDQLVRLFGDKRPATMRRSGENGGTTSGRVLRYRLDLGTLEVESGERDRAKIRPSTN
jgi:lipopolysaccharide transport protein LptA